jgi:hypothetical protein
MRRGVAVWMGCAMLLAGVAVANARGERELTNDELRAEMSRNRALAAYVARNGDPDMAESHFLSDVPPWDDHEVTLYYFEARKEIAFARAWILGRPDIHLERYERPLTDEHIAALTGRARTAQPPPTRMAVVPVAHVEVTPVAEPTNVMGPDERAEEAARRAEEAAARVEQAADAAEHAADRADAVTSQMQTAFHESLRK